jgi:hypothetical protein
MDFRGNFYLTPQLFKVVAILIDFIIFANLLRIKVSF